MAPSNGPYRANPELVVLLKLVIPLRFVEDGLQSRDHVARRGLPFRRLHYLYGDTRHPKRREVLLGCERVFGRHDEPSVIALTPVLVTQWSTLARRKEAHGVTWGIAPKRPIR